MRNSFISDENRKEEKKKETNKHGTTNHSVINKLLAIPRTRVPITAARLASTWAIRRMRQSLPRFLFFILQPFDI